MTSTRTRFLKMSNISYRFSTFDLSEIAEFDLDDGSDYIKSF